MMGGLIGIHYEKIVDFIESHIKKNIYRICHIIILYIGHVYYIIITNGNRDLYYKFGSIRPHTMIYAIFTMPVLIWLTRRMVGKYNALKKFWHLFLWNIFFSSTNIRGNN